MREITGLMENVGAPEVVDCTEHMDASSFPERIICAWAQPFSCEWVINTVSDKENSVYGNFENAVLNGRRCSPCLWQSM